MRDDKYIELDYALESGKIVQDQFLKFKEECRWETAW